MYLIKSLLVMAVICASPLLQASDDEAVLLEMLNVFLAGASVNDAAAHDRFWADELIYTSSSGSRFGKDSIMDGMKETPQVSPEEAEVVYSAENIQVRLHHDAAVVAFRLLGKPRDEALKLMQYYNTGTFVKRQDEWRAVAWQATRIPPQED